MTNAKKRIVTLAGTLILTWVYAPAPASAKFISNYSSSTQYAVEWTQMPDFDQVRDGLPNNGLMYCVPTANINAITYIAHHGYPAVAPGDHGYYWWMSQAAFPTATVTLNLMGTLMGTDPINGTGGNGAMNGITSWLPSGFLVFHTWASGFSAPRATDLAGHMLAGHLVVPVVGWYNQDNYPILARNGGHALTLTKVVRSGSNISISWRDPANEQSDLGTQSPFQSHAYAIESRPVIVSGNPRVMDKIVNYGSAYLDEYFAIMPLFGLTQTEDHLHLQLLFPAFLSDVPHQVYEYVPSPSGQILKTIPHPEGLFLYLLTDDGNIWKYDPSSEQMRQILHLPGTREIVFDRFGKLYVLLGRTLSRYSIDENDAPTLERYLVVPDTTDTLIADDFHDSLLLLSPPARQILRYDYDLTGVQETINVNVPRLPGKGALAVDPIDGTLFVSSDQLGVLYELQKRSGVYTPVAFGDGSVSHPRGLNVSDERQVIASCDGSVRVFRRAGAGWQENLDDPFDGLSAGDSLVIPCSRTNFDPRLHTGPAFVDILPTQFSAGQLDCQGDIDEDGDTDLSDLAALLGAYGSTPGDANWLDNADTDDNGVIDVSDLAYVLANYGCGG
jgi:hypothetical protein